MSSVYIVCFVSNERSVSIESWSLQTLSSYSPPTAWGTAGLSALALGYTCMLTSVLKNTSWAGTLKVVHFVVCMLYSIRKEKKKYDSRLWVCQSSCWSWTASVSSDPAAVLLSSNPCSQGDFREQESSHLALSKNSMLWGYTGQPRTFRQNGEACKTGAVEASIRVCWDNSEKSKVKPMLGWERK